ncbi:MAG: sulfatase-like hydrolase/transferase [Anaerolineales bacterium]|nr:sulfatase-like hydrolase/transferase [Anaerolineales bacterium]
MSTDSRPNFLIIITDQFNPNCLGYAGHSLVRTPCIDQLAASGMIYTRMYTTQPLCMPARATLFTGLTPRGHRVRMNGIPLDPSIPTFTEALRQAGYITHYCGKIHLSNSAPPKGVPLAEVNPKEHPECRPLWLDGTITDLPKPFYGLESTDYVNGHGHNSYGHYLQWLNQEYPYQAKLFYEKVSLEPPSPAYDLFNRSSYKWALPAELHPMTWIANRTIDFLNEVGRQRRESDGYRPFMLMCSIQEPHPPFAPPAPYCYAYDPNDVLPPLGRAGEYDDLPPHFRQMYENPILTSGNHSQSMSATEPNYAECAAHYFGLIEMLDDQVGRVMEALRANGLEDNTVVIFLSDHGEALGDHGMWGKGPYHIDSVIRVPFLVSWPGHITPGAKHEGPVSLLSFAPTILDLAGVPIPEGTVPAVPEAPQAPPAWPGRSLVPVLSGEDTSVEGVALVEMDEDYLGFKMRTLVTHRYRLTAYSGYEYGELFDLHKDPREENNLWDNPTFRQLRNDLQLQLLQEVMRTDISVPRQISRS